MNLSAASEPWPARRRAVVIGGSIAGLLTARVLSDRFAEVLVVDRDRFPVSAKPRNSVPQEHHVHLLLQRGQQIMERFFPGFLHALRQDGAQVVDLGRDVKCHQAGAWKSRWRTDITAHYCTRTLLEHSLRRRVCTLPTVTVQDGTSAEPLFRSGRVWGARLQVPGEDARELEADLVVDASGRGSQLASQLARAGLGNTPTEEIVTRLGYVSAQFAQPVIAPEDWKVLLCLPRLPAEKRMAVISPIEGRRWMVTAGAWFGQEPEPTHEDLRAYLRALPVPDLHDALRSAEPLDAPRRYRMPGGLRRHFDRLRMWPEGLLAVGDSVCSINPIYSQGMSASALQVEALADAPTLTSSDLQRRICASVELPWRQAAAVEERFEGIGPRAGLGVRLRRAYFDRFMARARNDRELAVALMRVNNLIADPASLTTPAMIARVMALRAPKPQEGLPGA